jgi:integrase/recombinase XerC
MKSSLQDYRLDFLDYLAHIRGYSELTLKSYDEALEEAFTHMEVETTEKGERFNLMPLRIKIASQKPKTIARKLSAIRSFCEYLKEQGEHIELRADESIKVPKTLPKPIPHEHIEEALKRADLEQALVVTMLYTLGLRISELANIRLEDMSDEWVRIRGKGNKEREVPLIDSTRELIGRYRGEYAPKRFLFERRGDRLSENSLRYTITKLFKSIGIKVTPHQLRHSYATALLNNRARIADVSELLGHASMATTQIYTKLGSALKMDNYLKSHPLCKGANETD